MTIGAENDKVEFFSMRREARDDLESSWKGSVVIRGGAEGTTYCRAHHLIEEVTDAPLSKWADTSGVTRFGPQGILQSKYF